MPAGVDLTGKCLGFSLRAPGSQRITWWDLNPETITLMLGVILRRKLLASDWV